MSIRVEHTAQQGTLVYGTCRGDGTNVVLKSCGFRWFSSLGLWGIARSRDRNADQEKIGRAASALREAGFAVDVEIDDQQRSFSEAEADRIARADQRADALARKADRKHAAAHAANEADWRAHEMLPPGGEPIKIGHHSEQRHRNAIKRANAATRRAITATADANEASRQAQTAATATQRRYRPTTVANRIDKLQAQQRADQRELDGYRRVVARSSAHTYIDEFPAATGARKDTLTARMDARADEITYWTNMYTRLQNDGIASTYSQENISAGDLIKYRQTWHTVVRANKKTVSVHFFPGVTFTNTVKYAEISGHQAKEEIQDTPEK